ncbi:MAG TPA: hypothetical protein VHI53_06260 [Gaiellaceae bacterium]|jgi:hypothetical protein|nr:hypothetical protein [Gaiellaceae bacterium]
MATVVVVASSEVDRSILADHVDPEDELHVVIPAVEQSRLQWLTNDEDSARVRAREVGDEIAREAPVAEASVDVKGDVPSQAVLDAIAEHNPDRILLVLRTGEDATWLEEGELAQVPGEIAGVPVTHVTI